MPYPTPARSPRLAARLHVEELAGRARAHVGVGEEIEVPRRDRCEAAADRDQGLDAHPAVAGKRLRPRGGKFERHLRGEIDSGPFLPQERKPRGQADVGESGEQLGGAARGGWKLREVPALRHGHRDLGSEGEESDEMDLRAQPLRRPIADDRPLGPRGGHERERVDRVVGPGPHLETRLAVHRWAGPFHGSKSVAPRRRPEEGHVDVLRPRGGRDGGQRENAGNETGTPSNGVPLA